MLTKEELSEVYKTFDDGKIIGLAKFESKKLTETAIPVLINEIKRRGFDEDLINWINMERNYFKGSELEILKSKIKHSKCVSCNTKKNDIKGFHIHHCAIVMDPDEMNLILCESCGKMNRIRNYKISATLGWISKTSIVNVPFYFINEIFRSFSREKQSNKIVENFIFQNTGSIRKNGFDNIETIIGRYNNYEMKAKKSDKDYIFHLI